MTLTRRITLAAALFCFLPATPASAEDAKADVKLEQAKRYYDLAQSHMELGEYKKAAGQFLRAHEFYANAEFFFNAAEMFRLADEPMKAAEYFRKYLTAEPKGRVADTARATLKELQPSIDAALAEQKRVAARQERAEQEKAAAAAEPPTEEPESEAATAGPSADVGADEDAPAAGQALKLSGIVTAGVGVASLGVGAYFGLDASSSRSELEELRSEGKYGHQLDEDRSSSATLFYVFTGVGAAALLGGGVLYYLGIQGDEADAQASIAVAPIVTDTGASIWCTGRF